MTPTSWLSACLLLLFVWTPTVYSTMDVDTTPLYFPPSIKSMVSLFRDIYADESKDLFIVLSSDGPVQLNYNRTIIQNFVNMFISSNSVFRLDSTLAASDGFLYFIIANYTLVRMVATDITNTTLFYIRPFFEGSGVKFSMTIHPTLKYGVVTNEDSQVILFFDALTMTVLTQFNATQQATFDPYFSPARIGVKAPTLDTSRNLLYFGGSCSSPLPAIIMQYNIADIFNPVLVDYKVFSGSACFLEGFVEPLSGRLWAYEASSGWVLGFENAGMGFDSKHFLTTASLVNAFEYDATSQTVFWFDGTYLSASARVYRVCTLEDHPAAVREIEAWRTPGGYPCGTFWEAATSTLYVTPCAYEVFSIKVSGASDCPTTLSAPSVPRSAPSHSSASWLSSVLSLLY